MQETYTRNQVIAIIEEMMQYADTVVDYIQNENTNLWASDLLEIVEDQYNFEELMEKNK